jgi:hypothetical protein
MVAAPVGGLRLQYNVPIPFHTCSLMKGIPMPSVSTGYLVLFCGLLLMVVPALISAPLPLFLTGLLLLALPFLFRG